MSASLARLAARQFRGSLPPLVLMTDDERLPDPCPAAERLPRGSLIVLRARRRERRRELAVRLGRIARDRGLFLVVASDPDLAARLGAHGVHFPEARVGEIAHWLARRPHWFVTTSAHSLRAAARAASLGADAVFLSPVFATRSHPGRSTITPIRLRLMTQQLQAPVYALGGIDSDKARRLAGAKLAGLAAVGALSQ